MAIGLERLERQFSRIPAIPASVHCPNHAMEKKSKLNKKVPMKKKGAVEDTKEKVFGWRWVSWKG